MSLEHQLGLILLEVKGFRSDIQELTQVLVKFCEDNRREVVIPKSPIPLVEGEKLGEEPGIAY